MYIKSIKKALENAMAQEPIYTDKGEVILSQFQIDEQCSEYKKLIFLIEKDQVF